MSSDFGEDQEYVLHEVDVRLYPATLEGQEGKYYARTAHEDTLNVADVVSSAATRTKFTGEKSQMLDYVTRYIKERNFLVCDGHTVNEFGYLTWYPHFKGLFDGPNQPIDKEKNYVEIRHISGKRLKEMGKKVKIGHRELAHVTGDITSLVDADNKGLQVNTYEPGDMVCIHGKKIKVAGEGTGIGVFFVSKDDPNVRVEMTRIILNEGSRIIGEAPNTGFQKNYVEIVTQYIGGTEPGSKQRIIKSEFAVQAM